MNDLTSPISTCNLQGMETNQTPTIYKDKKGGVKYYANYQSAWNACIRLNATADDGQWLFEADTIGWFLEFHKD